MKNLIGQTIGRYHITELIGEGGMAIVYKALDERLERNVAIKFIRVEMVTDQTFLVRFQREARALSQLSHPNIVKILDSGEYEGLPYLVMEYIPNGNLAQHLGKPIPWQEAVTLLMPIMRALDYAHDNHIVHRDLKPANFLIGESGEMLLSDFGIAKIIGGDESSHLTGTGVGVGTPEYMSPEQGMGKTIDRRADVYALGVVLFEMITGHKPYEADTPVAVMLRHISEPMPSPRTFVPDLPYSVVQLLYKSMEKDPDERYHSMAAFAEAIDNLLWHDTQQKTGQAYEAPSEITSSSIKKSPKKTGQGPVAQPQEDESATVIHLKTETAAPMATDLEEATLTSPLQSDEPATVIRLRVPPEAFHQKPSQEIEPRPEKEPVQEEEKKGSLTDSKPTPQPWGEETQTSNKAFTPEVVPWQESTLVSDRPVTPPPMQSPRPANQKSPPAQAYPARPGARPIPAYNIPQAQRVPVPQAQSKNNRRWLIIAAVVLGALAFFCIAIVIGVYIGSMLPNG